MGDKIRVGINGFGRIGRALLRKILEIESIELVLVNDIESDINNLIYLLRFDSVYGRLDETIEIQGNLVTIGDRKPVHFLCTADIKQVPWAEFEIDVIIEATGVETNLLQSPELIRGTTKNVIVTNAHRSIEKTVIVSVNEADFDPVQHPIVSSSICDANAIAPVLYHLDLLAGIEHASVTTLHPWLAYQNLLDGTVSSVANPGHSWQEYSLGRSSVGNLILKSTTAGTATLRVLPHLEGKLDAISFRVPTANVSASDFSITLSRKVDLGDVTDLFEDVSKRFPEVIALNREALVSSDFSRMTQSCVIDLTKMNLLRNRHLKIISWYDNEWAYSCRVLDIVALAGRR